MITKLTIASKAFEMFRDWSSIVKHYHPEISFCIIDETVLVNDLIDVITSAKKTLNSGKYIEDRKIVGFDIGFMLGYIGSQLNVIWETNYLYKNLPQYKELMMLKAIQLYFLTDTVNPNNIDKIYRELINEDINIDDFDFSCKHKHYEEYDFLNEEAFNSNLSIVIQNLINKIILQQIHRKVGDYMPKTEKYFSNAEIEFIIKNKIV